MLMTAPLFHHTKQTEHCPQCGSELHLKQGKKGLFWGCSAYPACDYLKPVHQTEVKTLKRLEQTCPECGHLLALKQGQFGMFIGCSDYPSCHFVVHEQQDDAEQTFPCPECEQGQLVARRGRQGKTFYGCSRFPDCKFTLPAKPVLVKCPQCAGELALVKKSAKNHRTFQCVNKSCRYIFNIETNDE